MNFMGNGRQQQGLYDDKDEAAAQGQYPLYPCSNSSSSPSPSSSSHPHHHHHHHQTLLPLPYHHQHHRGNWLDGQTSNKSQALELMTMDSSSSPAALNNNKYAGDDEESCHQAGDRDGGGVGAATAFMAVVEREHMFDKVVTPSDVGKLNRLVIPKQHAERYFPLDSSTNEKGLLLNFEDRNGKPWRFRYSYWNSSQSYVMTKGWSRFVKEKKLDAGDIVSFQRGVGDLAKDRLFIDWRHRPDAPPPELLAPIHNLSFPHHFSFQHRSNMNINPWNPLFLHPHHPSTSPVQPQVPFPHLRGRMVSNNNYSYGGGSGSGGSHGTSYNNMNQCSGSVIYFRSGGGGGPQQQQEVGGMMQMQRGVGVGPGYGMDPQHLPVVFESVPVVHGKAAAKRLRLFGVNMDCPISSEDDECHMLHPSSSNANYHHYFPNSSSSSPNYSSSSSPSSSSSSIPYLQLRGTPLPTTVMLSSDLLNKTKSSSSSMSLDLDI